MTTFVPDSINIIIKDKPIEHITKPNIRFEPGKIVINEGIEFYLDNSKFSFCPPDVFAIPTTGQIELNFDCFSTCKIIEKRLIFNKKKLISNLSIKISLDDLTTTNIKNILSNIERSYTEEFIEHNIFNLSTPYLNQILNYIRYIESDKHDKDHPFFRHPLSFAKNSMVKMFEPILELIFTNFEEYYTSNPNLTTVAYIDYILQQFIIQKDKLVDITTSNLDNNELIKRNFQNPFVIIISILFLQGLIPKITTKYHTVNRKIFDIGSSLMDFVSRYASYDLKYNNSIRLIEVNECIKRNKAIRCGIYNRMLEFLSIFYTSEIITQFDTNTMAA